MTGELLIFLAGFTLGAWAIWHDAAQFVPGGFKFILKRNHDRFMKGKKKATQPTPPKP
jgi:hypothetical protein